MRKFALLMFAVGLMAAMSLTSAAQDTTPEVTPDAGTAATPEAAQTEAAGGAETITTTIRLAHFAPDAPDLLAYVDGAPSGIQALSYPAVTGWVEIPAETFTIMLIPVGGAQSQAVLGPITLTRSSDQWTTIAVVGSAANNTLAAYSFTQDFSPIPENCARVTVLHAIEGAPAVDVRADDTLLASGLGFPGGDVAESVQAPDGVEGCASAASMDNGDSPDALVMTDAPEMAETAEADEADEAEVAATDEANADDSASDPMTGDAMAFGSAITCRRLENDMMPTISVATDEPDLTVTEDINATEEAQMTATEETESATTEAAETSAMTQTGTAVNGERFENCGYTFDVPAGTYNVNVGPSGNAEAGALLALPGTGFVANTYYLIAAIGTTDAPSVFVYQNTAAALSGILGDDTMDATEEAVDEVTSEPTIQPTAEPTLEATPEVTATPGS